MADERDTQIAVLQEQMKNLKEQQNKNAETNEKLFMAQSLDFNKKFDDQSKLMSGLSTQMKELNAVLDRGRGAYTASMLLASVIGAGVMAAIEYFKR